MSQLYFDAGPKATGQKACLATTAYDGLDASHVFSIQGSREALREAGIQSAYILLSGNCHVDDARNTVVREFLNTDCTDLVFLDADVSWDTDALVTLCRLDRDVVGGVYPYRRAGMENALPVRPLLTGGPAEPGLVEVEGLPTGFLRIRRHVLAALAERADKFTTETGEIPIIFERTFENGVRWGGDLKFCRKWREMGGHVYAASELRLGHAGKHVAVDSMAAMLRRSTGMTLRHVADLVRQGRAGPGDYTELFDSLANPWGAPPVVLEAAVAMARGADGPIIEAGSGATTVLMAAATGQTVFCLEHDGEFATRLEQMARSAGVGNIGLCHAPLKDGWYDIEETDGLPETFALGLVDGPPRAAGDRMRFFGLFGDRTATILCDDADEPAYAKRLRAWAEERGRPFHQPSPRLAITGKP